MSHSQYPSDISRRAIRPYSAATLESARPPDQAPHRGLVPRFLRFVLSPLEKRLPVANAAAAALPRLAHRRTSISGNGASGLGPGQDSILEQVLKKIGWRRPDQAMGRKEQTSCCIVDSQSVKNTDTFLPSRRAMTRVLEGVGIKRSDICGGHARIPSMRYR